MEQEDNELLTLELIHRYVELLDKYFGSVSIIVYIQIIFVLPKWTLLLKILYFVIIIIIIEDYNPSSSF